LKYLIVLKCIFDSQSTKLEYHNVTILNYISLTNMQTKFIKLKIYQHKLKIQILFKNIDVSYYSK